MLQNTILTVHHPFMHLHSSSKTQKNMRVVSSASLAKLSAFHRVLSVLLASLEVQWEDAGLDETWPQYQMKARLLETIEVKQAVLRPFPPFAFNCLVDQAEHPTFGFPKRLVKDIQDLFCHSYKQGWTHKTLLGACAVIVLATHWLTPVSASSTSSCSSKAAMSKAAISKGASEPSQPTLIPCK